MVARSILALGIALVVTEISYANKTSTGRASAQMTSSQRQNGFVGTLNNMQWAIYSCLGPMVLADVDDNECTATGYWYEGKLYSLKKLGITECKPMGTFYKKTFDVYHYERRIGTITRRGIDQTSLGHCIFGDGVDLERELGLDPKRFKKETSNMSLRNFRLSGEFRNFDVERKIQNSRK